MPTGATYGVFAAFVTVGDFSTDGDDNFSSTDWDENFIPQMGMKIFSTDWDEIFLPQVGMKILFHKWG